MIEDVTGAVEEKEEGGEGEKRYYGGLVVGEVGHFAMISWGWLIEGFENILGREIIDYKKVSEDMINKLLFVDHDDEVLDTKLDGVKYGSRSRKKVYWKNRGLDFSSRTSIYCHLKLRLR